MASLCAQGDDTVLLFQKALYRPLSSLSARETVFVGVHFTWLESWWGIYIKLINRNEK